VALDSTARTAKNRFHLREGAFMISRKLQIVVIAGLAWVTLTASAWAALEIGQPAPDFKAQDLSGAPHSLQEYRGKTVVLEWNNPGCPFVQKHYNSGNMQKLQKEFTQRGVIWLTVNSTNPGAGDYKTPAAQRAWDDEKHLASTAYLRDPDGAVGKLYGAKTTPHMFVVDSKGVLVYAGGIDDKRSADIADIAGAKNYVSAALNSVLAGQPVAVTSAPPYGCSVKY
jgi:peroxiredoxin